MILNFRHSSQIILARQHSGNLRQLASDTTKELKADPLSPPAAFRSIQQKGAHPRMDGRPAMDDGVKRQRSPSPSPLKFCFANTAAIYGAVNSASEVDSFVHSRRERESEREVIFRQRSSKLRNFRGVWGAGEGSRLDSRVGREIRILIRRTDARLS